MKPEQWNLLKSVVAQTNDLPPVGLIVDSPWMPGYCGCTNRDFYVQPDTWFQAYRKIKDDFPDLLLLPDWWCEYGMATEPSGFGCKISFFDDNLPVVHHILQDADDAAIDSLKVPNPKTDGLMPLLLNLQSYMQPRIRDLGEQIKIVSTRGPLTIASHLMEMTELLVGIKGEPDQIHKVLRVTTQLCKDWLSAQLEVVRDAEGILVLDDVTGFLNEEDFLEFSYPYIKSIYDAFPGTLHVFHNDAVRTCSYPFLTDMGVDVFNMTHTVNIGQIRKLTGDKLCLLGNIPPMSMVRETPETVAKLTVDMMNDYKAANGSLKGLIVSAGGGASMGAKQEQINAMIQAAKTFR